jgi:cell division transport system permease protein
MKKNISVSIIIITSLILVIMNIIFIINYNIQTHIKNILSSSSLIVFIRPNISKTEINFLKEQISKNENVNRILYYSSEELITHYKEEFYNLPEIISNLPSGPISNILKIYLKNPTLEKFQEVYNHLINITLIDDLEYGQEEIKRMNILLDNFKKFYSIINFVIILFSIIIITSAYNLYYKTIKKDIKIIKLSGANNIFFKKFFFSIAAVQGFISVIISIIFLIIPIWIILYIEPNISILNIRLYSPKINIIISLLFIGITLNIISSYIALKKYE